MVVFTCGQCNESLKKNQVEKHYQTRCRNCNVLSCVDCCKDFYGDSYKEHIKCITEEEKYSGKNYKPKPNANKGEVKQEQWTQKVQAAIDKCVTNPKLKNVLERMKDYPNIPRKKAKFENFVSNSMNVRDKRLVSEVWDLLLAHADQPSPETQETKIVENGQKASENSNDIVTNKEQLKKKSVEDRKAERKRVQNKEVNKNENGESESKTDKIESSEESSDKSNKKGKKRKKKDKNELENDENLNKKKAKKRKRQNTEDNDDGDETIKKKQHIEESDLDQTLNTSTEDSHGDENVCKMKFNWADTITAVLSAKGEISIKKLKKKVLSEYYAQGGKPKGEEKLTAKLQKKITKNPNFICKKERVKLKDVK